MSDAFIHGFCNELAKQASHPLFQTVSRGGTMLGQKVQGAIARTMKKSQKINSKAARGAGLKGVVEKKAAEKRAFFETDEESDGDEGGYDDADQAGEMLRQILLQHQQGMGGYEEGGEAGADAPVYGGGQGLASTVSAATRPPRPAGLSMSTVAKPAEKVMGRAAPRPKQTGGVSMRTVAKPPEKSPTDLK